LQSAQLGGQSSIARQSFLFDSCVCENTFAAVAKRMKRQIVQWAIFLAYGLLLAVGPQYAVAQEPQKSIGGKEHEDNVLGVRIGMDVPTALETVFRNANRKPGQEKPDAKRNEGEGNKDVRVLYKDLKVGKLEIVFAQGQWVKEILLIYAGPIPFDTLRLPYSSNIGEAMGGERYDDRYTVGFLDANKLEKFWWRDENTAQGYRVRIGFISGKLTAGGSQAITSITRKIITVTPGDEAKFLKATTGG
jgi:hypothetical protein